MLGLYEHLHIIGTNSLSNVKAYISIVAYHMRAPFFSLHLHLHYHLTRNKCCLQEMALVQISKQATSLHPNSYTITRIYKYIYGGKLDEKISGLPRNFNSFTSSLFSVLYLMIVAKTFTYKIRPPLLIYYLKVQEFSVASIFQNKLSSLISLLKSSENFLLLQSDLA